MARGDKNNGGGELGEDQANTASNPVPEGEVGSEAQAKDEALGRTSDMKNVPGTAIPTNQPTIPAEPGVVMNQRMEATSGMPEGDTGAHNAGNASPGVGDPIPALIRTQYTNQRVMGMSPDRGPSPWPIAPKPTDAGLVSPTGIATRPAVYEAAIAHLSMRLGEMRNFLAGFDHATVLAEQTEMHELVSYLKHVLGLPQDPAEVAAAKVGYAAAPAGPGSGGVARSGAMLNNGSVPVSGTSAGSHAQGSYGPTAVQENNH